MARALHTFTMNPKPFHMSDPPTFKKRYVIRHVLGEGSFGKVYAGIRVEDALPVAIKCTKKHYGKLDSLNGYLPAEVSFLHQLSHVEGVIKLIDACWLGETLTIVMERIEYCMDLYDFVENKLMTPALTQSLFRQLVETVNQCHSAGIIHNDIKPENILVDLNTNTIKLIDFGWADYYNAFTNFDGGTRGYKPPEAFSEHAFSCLAATVWSLGITLDYLACDRLLYEDPEDLTEKEVEDISFPDHVPALCQDLIRKLLTFNWIERPTLVQVLTHPYLQAHPHMLEASDDSFILPNFSTIKRGRCITN